MAMFTKETIVITAELMLWKNEISHRRIEFVHIFMPYLAGLLSMYCLNERRSLKGASHSSTGT
ncbi:hypothetical protein T10_4594 [Trichinella papuae]|uniref:Uncharacterized protein n=1 Tax=Trichinella papuae TaxID=268474 RepID=A0A0V1MFU1_9BILA|nr:hypothetical protein T10_4594 [Trichinella papuae]